MEDLIKRSDAINIIDQSYGDEHYAPAIMGLIENLPSADRPQGEWEIVAQGWHAIRRCSNCKWTQTYSDPKYMGYRYNYCPHCGAKMKGADE